jgi:hypothetical protein
MGDIDSLDKLLPLDPHVPSASYQAHERAPLYIPWTRKVLSLGAGLDIPSGSAPGNAGNLTVRPSALDSKLDNTPLIFESTNASNSFRQTESSSTASSYEHTDATFGISASCPFVGVSVQGEFAKSVTENRDVSSFIDFVFCIY